jgi:hypothetical protein
LEGRDGGLDRGDGGGDELSRSVCRYESGAGYGDGRGDGMEVPLGP